MKVISSIMDLKIFRDSIYYKIIFVIWALLHALTLGQYITGYFSIPIIVWGGILVLKNIFNKKSYINKATQFYMYVFLLSYIVTIFINRNSNLVGNTKTLIWQIIMMFVLFISEAWKSKDNVDLDIIRISKTVIVVTMILSLISLIIFFLNIVYWVNRVDGVLIPIGYYYARLWGIYVDPNQAAVIAIVSILVSIIVLISKKYKSLKLIISNIIIQYIFMILTASRGGAIGFLFGVIVLGYLLSDYILRNKITKCVFRSFISIFIALILSGVLLLSEAPIRKVLAIIPTSISNIKSEVNYEGMNQSIDIERNDLTSSNGRIVLWKDGLRLSKFSPIFGFGDRNIFLKAKELTPGSSLEKQYVHNGFIHMVLSGGIVAGITMLLLLFFAIIDIVKIVFTSNIYTSKYYIYSCIGLIVGASLITAIFLTELFYQNSFISTVFWIYLGFMVSIDKKELIG